MDFKLYQENSLVVVENNGKHTVYSIDCDEAAGIVELQPLTAVPTDSKPQVEVDLGLIFTTSGLFNLAGKKVSDFAHTKFSIHKLYGENNNLIVDSACSSILLLNGNRIVLQTDVKKVKYSKRYIAIVADEEWQIYRYNGSKLSFAYTIPEDNKLFLGDSLVVCGTPGNYRLYSLYNQELLCEKQNIIHCSPTQHFAICSELSGKKAQIFYNGFWKTFDDVECFTIVSDAHRLFALRKNGKYFVYNYDGTLDADLANIYPEGMDFVCFNDGLLLVMADGKSNFYSK